MESAIWALVAVAAFNSAILLWLHVRIHRQWERQHAASEVRHKYEVTRDAMRDAADRASMLPHTGKEDAAHDNRSR